MDDVADLAALREVGAALAGARVQAEHFERFLPPASPAPPSDGGRAG